MIRFEDISETVRRHYPEADLEQLRRAYIFSAVEHKGQTRASGEPYLIHPLEVANILAEMRMDPTCVAVGLLHDVLEDTLTTPERVSEYFGDDVLHVVEGVTKKNGLIIVPGDPENSLLIQKQSDATSHFGQLRASELQLVTEWIEAGAPEQ